jgi:DNA-binding XRE family transcriptional regulator
VAATRPQGSHLDRELARLLAQALVKDYRQFPPDHEVPRAGRPATEERLDAALPGRYQTPCPPSGDGPARPSSASGTNGADRLGCARNTIARIETGNRRPSLTLLQQLAGVLKVAVGDLFT